MRWRSVEAVPDLSDDEDYGIDDDAAAANDSASGVVDRRGQSTSPQPVQPVPPPGPRAPGDSSAPVPRRRSGGARGRRSPGLIEPEPEPEPEPEHVPVREPMGVPIGRGSSGPRTDLPRGGDSPAQPARQPTGVPIRRGSSGGGANSPALPPRSANSPALPGRRPAGVPIRQGSSGGGANSPALPPRDGTDSPALPARLPTPEKTTRMRHGGPRRTARPFIPQDDDEGEQVSAAEPVPPVVPAPPAADAAELSQFEKAMRQRRMRQEGRGGVTSEDANASASGVVDRRGQSRPNEGGRPDRSTLRREGERKNAVADASADMAAAVAAQETSTAAVFEVDQEKTARNAAIAARAARAKSQRRGSSSGDSAAYTSDEEDGSVRVPGYDSPGLNGERRGCGETGAAAMPGSLVADIPEPEAGDGTQPKNTPLSAISDRRKKNRRTSVQEVAMLETTDAGLVSSPKSIDDGDTMVDSVDAWKKSVAAFYQESSGGIGQTEASKRSALDFLTKAAVRQRQEAQEKLEEMAAAKEAEESDARKKRRDQSGDEKDDEKSDEDEEEDDESYGTRGSKLRPVGGEADKEWGDTAAIWNSEKVDYPRHPGREICVRYASTGRCKFCDSGMPCNFDHPPPDSEKEKERKYLRTKGLRVMAATWGNFTRKGKAVPGKSIDVTNALNAMIVEQGGVQLELPKQGKAHLPGFGDPCPGLKKQLRMEIVLSGGGKRTTKKKYKEHDHVMIYTRVTKATLYTKNCLAFVCPIVGLLIGILFAARWMWGNLYQGCVDANFSECSVNDGTYPVVTQIPCITPYNFSSQNVEIINVEMERGFVNITIAPTPQNLIIIEIQHIAKSNAAIIGLSSSAVLEDGILDVRNMWNDSHTEDAEVGPIHTLNCFRGVINITLPPDMAYLRPKLNVNITALPNVCSIWNPSGCNEKLFLGMTGWEWSKMALGLSEPFIEPYGNIYINSQAWYGLEPMAAGVGYLWTSMDLFTNAGTIELHEVELSNEVGEEATIRCTVDAPPDFESGFAGHPELGEKGNVVVVDAYAHKLAVQTAGGGVLDVANLELFGTEGQFAALGSVQLNATNGGGAMIQRVRHGDIDVRTEDGDVSINLGPQYFSGKYTLSPGASISVTDTNFTRETSVSGLVGALSSMQKIHASSSGGVVAVAVAEELDSEPLRPRPVDGIRYPCQVNPSGPGCHGPATQGDCTSCGR